MVMFLIWAARLSAIVGVMLCAIAVIARLAGMHWLGGFEALTLLQGGMAAMLFACLCYLARLVEDRPRNQR